LSRWRKLAALFVATEREPMADHAVKRRFSYQQPNRSQQSDPQPASKIL